jgi:glycosyltransferase involved in cell wall biosynthesis
MTQSRAKVSVIVLTYNHEAYISRALESILAQRADFDVEILVSDDASTDGTLDILEDYERRHPGELRVLRSAENLCTNEVLARAYNVTRGEYVALLEGDDYWTSRSKLRAQVEFLTRHPDYSGCFHAVSVQMEDGPPGEDVYQSAPPKSVLTVDDLWGGNPIATCSIMYRKACVRWLPDWYRMATFGDWPLHILFADHGPLGYMPDVMACYRIHASGFWTRMAEVQKLEAVLAFYGEMDAVYGDRYWERIQAARIVIRTQVVRIYARQGSLISATRQGFLTLREAFMDGRATARDRIELVFRIARRVARGRRVA